MTEGEKTALFVFPTAILGGAERVMFNVIAHLLDSGYRVTVYIMSRGRQPGWEHLAGHANMTLIIKDYASEKSSLGAFFFALVTLSYRSRFDYVFSSHTHVNAVLSLLRKLGLLRCRFLVARESTFIFDRFFGLKRFIFLCMYRFFYGAQDLLVCQTERMKTALLGSLGFSPARQVMVIPNPVNIQNIDRLRREDAPSGLAFPRLVVGCGRLVGLKKFDLLIAAYAEVAQDFLDYGLVIVGDGPDRLALEQLAESLGLAGKVVFTGRESNPVKWFAQAAIGVISSEREGFPNVLIEMMAAGTQAVITTPCTDGVVGLPGVEVVAACDTASIAAALRQAMSNPVNNASRYREYIEDFRSVDYFWSRVTQSVGH